MYLVQADLEARVGGAAKLIELTDDDGDATPDAGVLTIAINQVCAMADSYFRAGGLDVPITDASALSAIKDPLLDIANYKLRTRDNREATDGDLALYNQAIAWLESVAKKEISLVSSSADVAAGAYAIDSDRRRFSQRDLRGM